MDKEAGVNALIGMGVAIQLMAMGAVLLFLRFIWRKFFSKAARNKFNGNEVGSFVGSSAVDNLSELSANANLDNASSSVAFKPYKLLRGINWFISMLILLATIPVFLSAKIPSFVHFIPLTLLGIYIGTAIALNNGVSFLMGIPLTIRHNSFAVLALLIINCVLGLLFLGLVFSELYKHQYGGSIYGFLWLTLSFANTRALWAVRNS